MSGFLIFVGVVALTAALVALVRGQVSWLRISSRKAATGVLVGSFVLLGAGQSLATPSTAHHATAVPVPSSTGASLAAVLPATTTTPIKPRAAAIATTTRTTTTVAAPHTVHATPRTTTRTAPKTTTRRVVPPSTLTCSASMSNTHPTHNTNTTVQVRTGASGASVTATAHYKSKDTTHSGTANTSGAAGVTFDIATATIGYTVDVDVTVNAHGASKSCVTSFTPVKA